MPSRRPSNPPPLNGDAPAQIAREVSSLQASLLARLREELTPAEPERFADSAARLATAFGEVTAAAVEAVCERSDGGRDPVTGLHGAAQMRHRLAQLIECARRYGHPFSLVLLDFEGPVSANGQAEEGREPAVLPIVATALRESIRLADEAYRLDDDELCVLAPDQLTGGAVKMARRLARMLVELEASGGLKITVSAGVASCPEHGNQPEQLLREADTAMWRARATGQPVAIAGMQDR